MWLGDFLKIPILHSAHKVPFQKDSATPGDGRSGSGGIISTVQDEFSSCMDSPPSS